MTKTKLFLTILLTLVGIAITAVFLSRPFYDADFFWHLKTGEWMWLHKSLMTSDAFTLPPIPSATPRSQFIMTSYWLSQSVIYFFYAIAGLPGVVLYRWIIGVVMIYGFHKWGGFKNSSAIASGLIFWVLTFDSYFVERPHFLSFVFLGALLIVVFNFMKSSDTYSTKQLMSNMSLVMLLWGNMHGGFLVGQAILILILLAEGVKIIYPLYFNALSIAAYKKLIIASLAAIVASLCNPNPLNSLKMLFSANETNNFLYTTNFEYTPLVQFITVNHTRVAMLYIAAMFLSGLIFFASKQRSNITWLAILLLTAYMGFKHIRYVPFFFIAATLCISKIFITEAFGTPIKAITLLFCGLTTFYCLKDEPYNLMMLAQYGLVPAKEYPVHAADYIEKNRLQGNIFNDFNWGGYLLWRFGEDNRMFCDGRQLYPSRYWEYLTAIVASTSESGWKKLFDTYNIQTVILPFFGKNGEPVALTSSIRADKNWVMVFAKNNAAVFRRKTPQNIVAR